MRVQQAVAEAMVGLRRNTVMTAAAVLTVSLSLALLGAALMLRNEITTMQAYYYTKIEVSVFLTADVTDQERKDIRAQIVDLRVVKSVNYESSAEAYRRYLLQFKDQPDLRAAATETNLPESYRVKLRDPTKFETVRSALAGAPGVEEVVDQKAILDKLFGVLGGLRDAALALAAVQLVAATLLISNTIRVTAFARRHETAIMRLVGATRLQIQLPFLIEGVVAGATGSFIAVGLLAAGKGLVLDRKLEPLFASGLLPAVHWAAVLMMLPVLTILGVVISAVASLLTARRYVRL
ncbi:MAG: cell division transport system permease protein [Actinomycetota bacterium]|nr:cell division transport system permease protein [Actinomycetota bacterium]